MSEKKQMKSGYDAPISIQDDCFDHARTARSIHSLVMGTPADWSVRVGIYSEWGSGKTTVCHFVGDLLDKNEAVTIWFNPWQYRTKDDLCFGFVTAILSKLKSLGYKLPRSLKLKKSFAPLKKLASGAVASWNNLAGEGFNVLTSFVNLGLKEAEELKKCLGDKRVVVFIDDLDRTDPKLVPELLFALREIMDIPGFAFLCAFDPNVVGKVLGEYHSGFGDGLAFLDKIIDYPIWLPTPNEEQLMKMAVRDIEEYASFVPVDAFRNKISMLPQNPRSIRQFIRMLTMLSTQIDRHYAEKLNWPLILGSNVVRIRFPRIASYLLGNKFWEQIQELNSDSQKEEGETHKKLIKLIKQNTSLTDDERVEEAVNIISAFSSDASDWLVSDESRNYHFKIAEGPAAVTGKEFDGYFEEWEKVPDDKTLGSWVDAHSEEVKYSKEDVLKGLFEVAIYKRQEFMSRGVNASESIDANQLLKQTSRFLQLLEMLTADLSPGWFTSFQFEKLLKSFDQHAHFCLKGYAKYRSAEKKFLYELVKRFPEDLLPYYEVLYEITDSAHSSATTEFFAPAKAIVADKLAVQIIQKFGSYNFIKSLKAQDMGSHHVRLFLFDVRSPIWTTHRDEAFAKLKEAHKNAELRHNALDLFAWMTRDNIQTNPRTLANDKEVIKAWFEVLVEKQLEPRTLGGIRNLFSSLDPTGILFKYPEWWIEGIKSIGLNEHDSVYPLIQKRIKAETQQDDMQEL